MKRIVISLSLLLAISLACGLASTPETDQAPGVATVVAETIAALPTAEGPATEPPPTFTGRTVEFQGGSLTIPPGLAAGASGVFIPPASGPDLPPWEVTPGHIELTLDGYALQGTFHTPKIYIFPAQSDALPPGAIEDINLLIDLIANPDQLLGEHNLPSIPFFNAGAVFVAKEDLIQFRNGSGVRMLTQYAQSFAKVNNHELFYHFQGLSDDRRTYLIAVLPVSAATLPADASETAAVPAGGVLFPGYANPDVDFQGYYAAVRDDLNRQPAEAFNPNLTALDALVASLLVSPP
jgi:hypothetical protein